MMRVVDHSGGGGSGGGVSTTGIVGSTIKIQLIDNKFSSQFFTKFTSKNYFIIVFFFLFFFVK